MRWLPLLLLACSPSPTPPDAIVVGSKRYDAEVVHTRAGRFDAVDRLGEARDFGPFMLLEARPRFLHYHTTRVTRGLDVVFIGADWTIVDAQSIARETVEGITSAKEAAAALFLASGEWAKTGAKVGDAVDVPDAVKKLKPEERHEIRVDGGKAVALAEMVTIYRDRGRGLMHRDRMSDNDGMLFKYDAEGPHSFWMKNTKIPLTIAYIKADGTIDTILDMKPLDESGYPAKGDTRYALEMNQGWYAKNKITEGMKLVFPKDVLDAEADP